MNEITQTKSAAHIVEISVDQDGQRLDNFLTNYLKSAPKSYIYRIVRKGEVRVNKGRIKPNHRLKVGDHVRIPPVQVRQQQEAYVPASLQAELKQSILMEDDGLLIINKPAGLAVHKGSGILYGVIDVVRSLYDKSQYLELVHRLDRETSGCLMIAKSRQRLLQLQKSMVSGELKKFYLLFVRGHWDHGDIVIDQALDTENRRHGERHVVVSDKGKTAITKITIQQAFAKASLLEAKLLTGRTHQIRVHCAYKGHVLLGDTRYGDDSDKEHAKKLKVKRLQLHAHRLSFHGDRDSESIEISAPMPEDMRNLVNLLEPKK